MILAMRAAAIIGLAVVMTLGDLAAAQDNGSFEYYGIEGFSDSSVSIQRYRAAPQEMSIVAVSPHIRLSPLAQDLLRTLPRKTINERNELDAFIVRNGLGEVLGDGAPDKLREMQTLARAQRIGMWASLPQGNTESPAPSADSNTADSNLGNGSAGANADAQSGLGRLLYSYWKELVALGLISGVLGFLLRFIYRRIWVQRRVVVSVIGLKGSGKSSVLNRFNNPHLTEEWVAKSSPTIAREKLPRRGPIPVGRYEVVAELNDNPGEDWGEFFQTLATRRGVGIHIALLVLAPTDEADATSASWRKEEYIVEQIGFAKGLIGGCLQARKIRKPRLVIIYLNKFDLLSEQSPEDSSSRAKATEFRSVFRQLLDQKFITDRLGKGPAPIVRIIVGSALKDWGNKAIMLAIQDALYMKSQ
jgi:hypothetical protein